MAPPPPPTNCKELKETEDQHNSGVYAVDCELTGQRTCTVYCEMTKAGGGWTLLINLETSDGTSRDWDDTTFWTGPAARHNFAEINTFPHKRRGTGFSLICVVLCVV